MRPARLPVSNVTERLTSRHRPQRFRNARHGVTVTCKWGRDRWGKEAPLRTGHPHSAEPRQQALDGDRCAPRVSDIIRRVGEGRSRLRPDAKGGRSAPRVATTTATTRARCHVHALTDRSGAITVIDQFTSTQHHSRNGHPRDYRQGQKSLTPYIRKCVRTVPTSPLAPGGGTQK